MQLVWLAIVFLSWAIRVLPRVFNFCFRCWCRYGVAGFLTPSGHTPYGDYHETAAYRDLAAEGYTIESRFAADAIAGLKTE